MVRQSARHSQLHRRRRGATPRRRPAAWEERCPGKMTRPAGANSTPHHPTPRPPFQGGARAGQPQARASQRKPGTPYSPPLPPTNKLPPPFPRRTCPCQPHGAAWLRAKKKAGQDAVKRSKGGKGGKKGGGGTGGKPLVAHTPHHQQRITHPPTPCTQPARPRHAHGRRSGGGKGGRNTRAGR